jgi:hypothetical protein
VSTAATPPPAVDPERQALLEELARKLKREHISETQRERILKLADDPDKGGVKPGSILEATDAVILESEGRLRGVRRAQPKGREAGADFVEANGRLWDHKQVISNRDYNQAEFLETIRVKEFSQNVNIIANVSKLSADDFAALQAEIRARGWTSRFIFIR